MKNPDNEVFKDFEDHPPDKNYFEQLKSLILERATHKKKVYGVNMDIKAMKIIHKYENELVSLHSPPVSLEKEYPSGPEYLESPKTKKSFPQYILHDKRESLALKLKTEFVTEKGKGIRLMLEALRSNEPPLINIENRERTNIYNAMKIFFERNIGSYQSIFSYPFNMVTDSKDFEGFRTRLNFIIGLKT
jgi:hypothetical protein